MEKVSIIIPVYNVEKYLVECIESVVNQTYPNIEVLLIDDGSPDGCAKICDKYLEKYNFVKVYHKENGGLCSARNYGLAHITGEWVLFVDADDWCATDYVEKMMKFAQEGCDAILSSVYCQKPDLSFIVEYGTFIKEGIYDNPEDMKMIHALSIGRMKNWKHKWSKRLDETGGNGAPWNKLYKMEILKKNGIQFEENTKLWEDLLFNMRYFEYVQKVCYADTKGYYYRYVDSGITKKFDVKRLQKERYFFSQVEEYSKRQKNNPYFEDAKKQRASMVLSSLVKYVANASKWLKIVDIKKDVHEYLQQPMLEHALETLKLNELNGFSVRLAVILARYEMVRTMCVMGTVYLKLRNLRRIIK